MAQIKNSELVRATHERIADAATRLMGKRGFDAMTVRDVSAETKIALGNMYAYIKSKDDILSLMYERSSEILSERRNLEQIQQGDPAVALRRIIQLEFESKDALQDLILVMYREIHKLNKATLKKVLEREEYRTEDFADVVRRGIESGAFRAVNPAFVAHMIVALVDGWILRGWSIRKEIAAQEMLQHILEVVFAYLEKGIDPGSATAKTHGARRGE